MFAQEAILEGFSRCQQGSTPVDDHTKSCRRSREDRLAHDLCITDAQLTQLMHY